MLTKGFFNPGSIAVIGASNNHHKIGFSILKNIIDGGFKGRVYPVNPTNESILGLKVYKSVLEIATKVDLGVIVVPAPIVPAVLIECGKKNIQNVIIISAGFAELGAEGEKRQAELAKISAVYHINILGPNCLGYINPGNHLNISFATNMPRKKDIAVVSQSGATCTAILDWANLNGIGFSQFVSLGNKLDLDENDFLELLLDDDHTKVVMAYLESISDGQKLLEVGKKITKVKPIVALKAGKTHAGQMAAASHTGALAEDDLVVDVAFREAGIIRAHNVEEFFDFANVFSNLEVSDNLKTLIITNAGGPGVMTADALASAENLEFYHFSQAEALEIQSQLDFDCKMANPLDLLGDATSKRFDVVLNKLKEKAFKIVVLTPQVNTDIKEIADSIVKNKDNKTIVVFLGGEKFEHAKMKLSKAEIPYFTFPERAVKALDILVGYAQYKNRKTNKSLVIKGYEKVASKILNQGGDLTDANVAKILTAYNIPMAESRLTTNANEAIAFAAKIGYPVVLKVTSPDILHKTEVGAIYLDIKDEKTLRSAYQQVLKSAKKHVPKARILGVTVYKMMDKKIEIALGAKRDPIFGPVIMFGLGGIYIELLKDYTLALGPITLDKAMEMIKNIRSFELLNGFRNGEVYDLTAIATAISGLSSLMLDFPQISEIDINPLRVNPEGQGVLALDAKIILEKEKITV